MRRLIALLCLFLLCLQPALAQGTGSQGPAVGAYQNPAGLAPLDGDTDLFVIHKDGLREIMRQKPEDLALTDTWAIWRPVDKDTDPHHYTIDYGRLIHLP